MRRFLPFALLALVIACQDGAFPSGPSERRTSCWAYITLIARDTGEEIPFWWEFDPCPSDSALRATGWTRGLNPMWSGR